MELDLKSQARLVNNLMRVLNDDAVGAANTELVETHISWVLLVGGYAYKIKKPLNLGFLDYSHLDYRRRFCGEEVRLNRRLAPDVYLGVEQITGDIQTPLLGGTGRPLEYCVKMRRFTGGILLSTHPQALNAGVATNLARCLAQFHGSVNRAGPTQHFGYPDRVIHPIAQNFRQVRALLQNPKIASRLNQLEHWTFDRFESLRGMLYWRKADGYIRECHGDLHLGNIALEDGRLIIFDGIEFNPDLRWVDIQSELAFLLMDMDEKRLSHLGWQLLDCYMEISGDYRGLGLLQFYKVYRAMVRAKVSALRLAQDTLTQRAREGLERELDRYLQTAEQYTHPLPKLLLITHGLSASGKSTLCRALLARLPAVRLRSDIERKRLAGLEMEADSDSPPDGGIYTREFTRQTYDRLLMLASSVLASGYAVIVDATFLHADQRDPFRLLAQQLGIPFRILDFRIPEQELRRRIHRRGDADGNPSEADMGVLERQLDNRVPLSAAERQFAIPVFETQSPTAGDILESLG